MENIQTRTTVTLTEAAELILASRGIRYFLEGEPGIGKTSIIKALEEATGYPAALISCPDLELGDCAMPVIDHERRVTTYYPSARFKLQEGKPVIICLDEYSKAPAAIQNMLHPLLDSFRPRLGDVSLPEGSIVFCTGNLVSDGVGDNKKAHTRSRVVPIEVQKDGEGWLQWAGPAGCHPTILAWVAQNPHAMASYREGGQEGNEYIFNPKRQQDGYFCPRSAMTASAIVYAKDEVSPAAFEAALAGAVGAPAAAALAEYTRFYDDMPKFKDIVADPEGTKIPTTPGAQATLVYACIEKITEETLTPLITYMDRLGGEWASIFVTTAARRDTLAPILFGNRRTAEWLSENRDLL